MTLDQAHDQRHCPRAKFIRMRLAVILASGRPFTIDDLRHRTGFTRSEITPALRIMRDMGIVRSERSRHRSVAVIWEKAA